MSFLVDVKPLPSHIAAVSERSQDCLVPVPFTYLPTGVPHPLFNNMSNFVYNPSLQC